jgi:hypothetical protein
MKYFIVYKLEADEDKEVNIAGPYSEFEYIHKAMDIISSDCVYDFDILNEAAMDAYSVYLEVEAEYKEACQNIIDNPGHEGWTELDQLEANRLMKTIPKEIIKAVFKEDTEQTLNTINTLETIEHTISDYDPYDCPF